MAMTGEITDEQLDLIIEAVVQALEKAEADISFLGTFYEDSDQKDLKTQIREVLR